MAAEPDAFLPLTGPSLDGVDLRALATSSTVEIPPGERWPLARDRVAFVVEGALLCTVRYRHDDAALVDVLGPGDVVGDDAFLMTEGTGSLELSALVPVRAVTVDAGTLWSLAGAHPGVARLLLLRLSRTVHRLRRRAAVLRSLGVRDRLVLTLRDLATAHGRARGSLVTISLPLTQDVLASIVGCSRESANRALRQLVAEGTIRRAGGAYVVPAAEPADPARANRGAPPRPSLVVTTPSRSSFRR